MIEFSQNRGFAMVDKWELSDAREFRTSWAINRQTGARRMSMLKPLFKYCLSNEWVTRNPARLIKSEWTRRRRKARRAEASLHR